MYRYNNLKVVARNTCRRRSMSLTKEFSCPTENRPPCIVASKARTLRCRRCRRNPKPICPTLFRLAAVATSHQLMAAIEPSQWIRRFVVHSRRAYRKSHRRLCRPSIKMPCTIQLIRLSLSHVHRWPNRMSLRNCQPLFAPITMHPIRMIPSTSRHHPKLPLSTKFDRPIVLRRSEWSVHRTEWMSILCWACWSHWSGKFHF